MFCIFEYIVIRLLSHLCPICGTFCHMFGTVTLLIHFGYIISTFVVSCACTIRITMLALFDRPALLDPHTFIVSRE